MKNNKELIQHQSAPSIKGTREGIRDLKGYWSYIEIIIGVSLSLFVLYVLGLHPIKPWFLKAIYFMGVSILTFLLIPVHKTSPNNKPSIIDIILIIMVISLNIYIFIDYEELFYRAGVEPVFFDLLFGSMGILVCLEMTRRLMGYGLPILTIVMILYARYGRLLPGLLGHRGYSLSRIISFLFSEDGIYGYPLAAASTFVVLFVLFGAFLQVSGAGQFFINIAMSITGGTRGGPAKAAVVASGLFGMISGSAVSNVVTTGTFTIPLIKKVGYSPRFAASVEAVSSTGGQFMPPVMSAAAFIMAEITGIPYLKIAAAAAIPACLYFFSIFLIVDIEGVNRGLKGMDRSELPNLKKVMINGWHLILPPFVLIFALVILRVSPLRSAIYGILTTVGVSWFKPKTRMLLKKLIKALYCGARNNMDIAAACALAGIVVGILNLTGKGVMLSIIILAYTGNNLFLTLLVAMIVCLILGMGIPTIGAYLIAAPTITPALIQLGVSGMAAHLFVLYFATISTITPPIAISSYAAAGLAGANPTKVGWSSVRLGIVAYIIPFLFVYRSPLLMDGTFIQVVVTAFMGIVGVIALAYPLQLRGLKFLIRLGLFVGVILLMIPGWKMDLVRLLVFICFLIYHYYNAFFVKWVNFGKQK